MFIVVFIQLQLIFIKYIRFVSFYKDSFLFFIKILLQFNFKALEKLQKYINIIILDISIINSLNIL